MRTPADRVGEFTAKREVTIVEVKYPQHQLTQFGKKFTTYEIRLKTTSKAFAFPQSSTRRRYSDFLWLRRWLQDHNEGFSSTKKISTLPPKKLLGRFDEEFLVERMRGLQRFLRRVIEQNVYLSDKALHLFLQSKMSIKDIDDYLNGKVIPIEDPCSNDSILLYHGEHSCSHRQNEASDIPQCNRLDVNSLSSTASSFCSVSSSTLHEIPEDQNYSRSISRDSDSVNLSSTQSLNETTSSQSIEAI